MKIRLLTPIKEPVLIVFIVMLLLSNCSKIFPDEELTLPRQEYTGDELRIDGYYYTLLYSKDNVNVYEAYFLFRDGKILYCGTTDLVLFEEKLINKTNNFGSSKTDWGIFVIDNGNIKFERWYSGSVGQRLPVYIKEGIILNDTTFKITKFYNKDGNVNENRDELYYSLEEVMPDTNTYRGSG